MEIAHNRRIHTLDTSPGRADEPRPRFVSTFAFFLLLAIVHTWPLATAPGRLSRQDNADTILNEWIVAWVEHQLPRDPAHLFDANIFYPDRHALAYSEPLIVPALIGAPLAWAGVSPVFVYNVLVLAGFALTGTAFCAVVQRWTGDRSAGLVAGTVAAFNAHTLTRIPQLQALHMEFFPIALVALDWILSTRERFDVRGSALLAATITLAGLTSYYTLMLTVAALAAGLAVRVDAWPRVGAWAPLLLAAAAISAVALFFALAPYRRLEQIRPLDEVALYSATWTSYLMTPARIHYEWWSARFFTGATALFPGVIAIALAGVAIATGAAFRDPRARMALAFGIAGMALSFGPGLPGYEILYHVFWPLQGIRNAARFGFLAIESAAILAGFGIASIRRYQWAAPSMPVVALALLFLANVDALAAPVEYVDAEIASPIHARLRHTTAIVAEFPFYPPERMMRQAAYLPHAMLHWRPMVNGYSGVVPNSYLEIGGDLSAFPAARAIAALHRIGVTHIFVHDRALRDWTDNETADAVPRSADLELVDREHDVSLYRLR